jgi:aminotransferase
MFQILELAKNLEKKGRNVIHMEIGDPDFNSPQTAKDAAINAIKNNSTHYVASTGIDELKEASIRVTERSRGFRLSSNQLLVTSGANIQIYLACACLLDPDDEIIIQDPSFVSYQSIINSLRGKCVPIKLKEENNFEIDPSVISSKITRKTKAIIINSPHNPTGSVLSETSFREIYNICEKHGIYLISDEVYGRMIYSDCPYKFFSPTQIDKCLERTIMIHSFSKTYAMTGWRVGAVAGPREIIKKMTLLYETINSCVPPFIQLAAAAVLENDVQASKKMIDEYEKRRNLFVKNLASNKYLSCKMPYGAFYAFVNIEKTRLGGEQFCKQLLEQYGIAACPGVFFGNGGENYVRFCFATAIEDIHTASVKLKDFSDQLLC